MVAATVVEGMSSSDQMLSIYCFRGLQTAIVREGLEGVNSVCEFRSVGFL